jgi:hypothetical protein
VAQLTVSMSDKAIKIPSLCDAMTSSRCRFLALIRSSLLRSDATPVGENLVLGNQGRSPLLDSKSEPLNDSSLARSAGIPARLPYAAPFQVIGLNAVLRHRSTLYRGLFVARSGSLLWSPLRFRQHVGSGDPADHPLLFQLQSSCCIAANRRWGP